MPPTNPEYGGELSPDEIMTYEKDVADLTQGEKDLGMEGKLAGRVKYGLDPAGMMVMRETGPETARISEELGTSKEAVLPLIKKLHEEGPWKLADRLAAAEDPEIKAYLVMAAACRESQGGYEPAAYLKDRARVVEELKTFTPDKFEERREQLTARVDILSEEERDIDGEKVTVPVADGDVALPLAVQGYKGVVTRAGEMRFAQTAEIPNATLEEKGLVPGFGEVYDPESNGFVRIALDDPRMEKGARTVWVEKADASKAPDDMKPRAKRIAPGFVLTYADEGLGVDLVAASIAAAEKRNE